jgi:hypothetical protein
MSSIVVNVPQSNEAEEIFRSVNLSNNDWLILSQCVEAFAGTYRSKQSQTVTTYVTRNQLDLAVTEAKKMNDLLQQLDKLQAKLV